MRMPTDEEIVEIRAAAARRGTSALLVVIDAPVNASFAFAKFDLESFSRHLDAQVRDLDTSQASAFVDLLLWPTLDEALPLREKFPSIANTAAGQLYAAAGQRKESPLTVPLTSAQRPAGLGSTEADALLLADKALWAVTLPQGPGLVMRTPPSDVWLAAKAAYADAVRKRERIVESFLPYVRESIVWSAEPIDTLLHRAPAFVDDLRTAFMSMGGEGAAVRSKSL